MFANHHSIVPRRLHRSAKKWLDRGAVSVEKAMLTLIVILFGMIGVRIIGDPILNPAIRVFYGLFMRIYELVTSLFGG